MIRLHLLLDIDFQRHEAEVAGTLEPLMDNLSRLSRLGRIELDVLPPSSKLAQLMETIDEVHRNTPARVQGKWLTELLVEDEKTPLEWFCIAPTVEFAGAHISEKQWPVLARYDFPGNQAQAYRAGVEIAGGPGKCEMAFSERAKAAVEGAGLTGIEFVWIPDTSRYQAEQRYMPIVHRSLGRGVDHPWFDLRKRTTGRWAPKGHAYHSVDPKWRRGVDFFGGWQLKRGAAYGDALADRLLALFKTDQSIVESYRRVLRQYLPDTDFAYIWNCPDWLRWRGLCCNRKTRDFLVQARLLTKEEFAGIEVLDEPYAGAEVLDATCGGSEGPGPVYTGEELAEIRAELDRYWARFMTKPKPVRKPSLPRSLALLKVRKTKAPRRFNKPPKRGALAKANAELPAPIPAAWQKVLQVSNGATIENCAIASGAPCIIVPAEELPSFHKQQMEIARSMEADLPEQCLHVVDSRVSDFICLDLSAVTEEGDCRVVLVSHETGAVEEAWDNIATFLEDLLEEEEE